MTPRTPRWAAVWVALLLAAILAACGEDSPDQVPVEGRGDATKTAASLRSNRRAYDGAPPVVPHGPMGAECVACHNEHGMPVKDLGFAPPTPHGMTPGMSTTSHCQQCHVYALTTETFVSNSFEGSPQDLRSGARAYEGAPPVMPHPLFMRENCAVCHSGPAAREEIRTSHPDRPNCLQCHALESGPETAFRR